MTLAEARQYMAEGHFKPGSMYPKIEAIVEFHRKRRPAGHHHQSAENIGRALRGETGTLIVPG